MGLVLLTGCASGAGSSSPAEMSSAVPQSDSCDALDEKQISKLAGDLVGAVEAREAVGLPACLWTTTGGRVQVIRAPAGQWAMQLPNAVDQLLASGLEISQEDRRELDVALRLIRGGDQIDTDEACDMFSTVMEIQGQQPNSDETVQLFPSRDDLQAIAAQSCRNGYFTSVTLASPNLNGSQADIDRMSHVLSLAERE